MLLAGCFFSAPAGCLKGVAFHDPLAMPSPGMLTSYASRVAGYGVVFCHPMTSRSSNRRSSIICSDGIIFVLFEGAHIATHPFQRQHHFCLHGDDCARQTAHGRPQSPGSFSVRRRASTVWTTLFVGIEPDNAGTRVSKFKDYGCIVTDKPQSAIPDDDPRRAIVGNVHDVIRSCCSFL